MSVFSPIFHFPPVPKSNAVTLKWAVFSHNSSSLLDNTVALKKGRIVFHRSCWAPLASLSDLVICL
jgi:hypothetical protein